MRVVAEDAAGTRLTEFDLDHGLDPVGGVGDRGYRVIRPLAAVVDDGETVIKLLAERDGRRASQPTVGQPTVDGPAEPSTDLPVRQRLAAHAWVESSRGVLAAQFYRGSTELRWGPPGGGVDPGEAPADAVHREVMEETGQRIELGDLVTITSRHRIGPNLAGEHTDFHGIGLIYRAHCPEPTDPVVVEVGGTTSAATWFPFDGLQQAPWAPGWRNLLLPLFTDDAGDP